MAIIKHTILCPINYDYASSFAHTPLYNIKRSKPEKCVPTTAVIAFSNRPHIIVGCVCVCVYVRSYIVEMRFVQDTHVRICTYIMRESTRQ